MDTFLERHTLSMFTQEKTGHINRYSPISNKENEFVVKNLPTKKTPGLDAIIGELILGRNNTNSRDFPGGPVVKTLHFHCRGSGLDLCSGN